MKSNFQYCPKGHSVIFVEDTTLFEDYYYCEECDEIFVLALEKRDKEWFKTLFLNRKREEMIRLAKIVDAKRKVTEEMLIKLNLLKRE